MPGWCIALIVLGSIGAVAGAVVLWYLDAAVTAAKVKDGNRLLDSLHGRKSKDDE